MNTQEANDRHALNVRAAAESLNDALMRETDSLLKLAVPNLDQARLNFSTCMTITAALVSDDIAVLEGILDNVPS